MSNLTTILSTNNYLIVRKSKKKDILNVSALPVDKNKNILKFCPHNIGAQRPMIYFTTPLLS